MTGVRHGRGGTSPGIGNSSTGNTRASMLREAGSLQPHALPDTTGKAHESREAISQAGAHAAFDDIELEHLSDRLSNVTSDSTRIF